MSPTAGAAAELATSGAAVDLTQQVGSMRIRSLEGTRWIMPQATGALACNSFSKDGFRTMSFSNEGFFDKPSVAALLGGGAPLM